MITFSYIKTNFTIFFITQKKKETKFTIAFATSTPLILYNSILTNIHTFRLILYDYIHFILAANIIQ